MMVFSFNAGDEESAKSMTESLRFRDCGGVITSLPKVPAPLGNGGAPSGERMKEIGKFLFVFLFFGSIFLKFLLQLHIIFRLMQ